MVNWPTLFGIVQSVANEKGASQAEHQSVASDLGEWWQNGGKQTASQWSEAEARQWAKQNVEL